MEVMGFKIDENAWYARTHEWVRLEGDIALVGISDYAQDQLSDVVYVELPEVGDSFEKGDGCAVVESVKAASDCYAPLSGDIVEVNKALEETPQVVNEDPYGAGWFVKLRPVDLAELETLMDADAYQQYCAEEALKEGGH